MDLEDLTGHMDIGDITGHLDTEQHCSVPGYGDLTKQLQVRDITGNLDIVLLQDTWIWDTIRSIWIGKQDRTPEFEGHNSVHLDLSKRRGHSELGTL